jgi:hypothetical protein
VGVAGDVVTVALEDPGLDDAGLDGLSFCARTGRAKPEATAKITREDR